MKLSRRSTFGRGRGASIEVDEGTGRLALVSLLGCSDARAQTSFVTFESAPVRPLALSPDGSRLFVCNIPNATLEIFDIAAGVATHVGSVAVGMEPVAVGARTNSEVWVVYLSDCVSIVDVAGVPRVTRTLLVGDEPSDIVFASTGANRAFITTAHRGQNSLCPLSDIDAAGTAGGAHVVVVFTVGDEIWTGRMSGCVASTSGRVVTCL